MELEPLSSLPLRPTWLLHCVSSRVAAAACAGDLLLHTHGLSGLTLHPAGTAEELLLSVQEICCCRLTACVASHCILLWLQRSCCCQ